MQFICCPRLCSLPATIFVPFVIVYCMIDTLCNTHSHFLCNWKMSFCGRKYFFLINILLFFLFRYLFVPCIHKHWNTHSDTDWRKCYEWRNETRVKSWLCLICWLSMLALLSAESHYNKSIWAMFIINLFIYCILKLKGGNVNDFLCPLCLMLLLANRNTVSVCIVSGLLKLTVVRFIIG